MYQLKARQPGSGFSKTQLAKNALLSIRQSERLEMRGFKHIKRSFNSLVIDGLAKNEDKKTEGKKRFMKEIRN